MASKDRIVKIEILRSTETIRYAAEELEKYITMVDSNAKTNIVD